MQSYCFSGRKRGGTIKKLFTCFDKYYLCENSPVRDRMNKTDSMIKETLNIAEFNAGSMFEQLVIKDLIITDKELNYMSFYECDFDGCDFSKVTFGACTFSDCKFTNCNLTLVRIPSSKIENTTFSACKMVGIDWCVAVWRKVLPNKKRPDFTIQFINCVLNYSIFIELNLTRAKFIDCALHDTGFENADLSFANFTGSDLQGAIFRDTNLTKADLSKAKNYTINASRNIITKAKFAFPEALSLVYALDIELDT